MKGMAVTTAHRWPTLPDVPTFTELGYPDVTLSTEHFMLVPAGTPQERIDRLAKAVAEVLARDDVKARVLELGYEPVAAGPDTAGPRIAKDVAFFKDLIARAGIPRIE
jgi:tripartite-type tricarboxylate transporter receptor subunit TctC